MADDKKPDPIEDVREGLGLLFRAAKTALDELPTKKIEATLLTGVREVGRAVESVASTIEREVFRSPGTPPTSESPPAPSAEEGDAPERPEAGEEAANAQDDGPKDAGA